jgi:membrane glycosyltransferase
VNPLFKHNRWYAWLLFLLCVISTSAAGYVMFKLLWANGTNVLDVPIMVLFCILFFWITIGFWTATFGFIKQLLINEQLLKTHEDKPQDRIIPQNDGRTAIVMPIYNEDVTRVFAGLRAMYESLAGLPGADAFDFFILSDSTNPDNWVEEERAWTRMRQRMAGPMGLYYRRRGDNTGKKSGNLKQFCEQWGAHYRYMIVLDADSILTGNTMRRMVSRMEFDPSIGILQVPPAPVNRDSFFARLQQFSSQVYGGMFTSGYALWTQTEGNYWGHNAIIRVKPFMESCGLPLLPGPAPLGGLILSHDFVEAALIRRAGWKVVVASDLDGSYEESPTNLIDYAKRDQRWCQGNLQHLRLTLASGLKPFNRVHLAMGVMSYIASPLWLAFIILSLLQVVITTHSKTEAIISKVPVSGVWVSHTALALFGCTMLLLLLPKCWAFLLAAGQEDKLDALGGGWKLCLGILLETVVSMVIAPISMLFHTTFVLGTLLGHRVHWNSQNRGEAHISWSQALEAHASHTILGLGMLLLIQMYIPVMLPWALPVLFGMIVSVPISVLLSSASLGQRLREEGLLLIPEETYTPWILQTQHIQHEALLAFRKVSPHPFIHVITDPALNHLHRTLLKEAIGTEPIDATNRQRLERIAIAGGPVRLTSAEKLQLLRDPQAMLRLHQEAWKDWPLDMLMRSNLAWDVPV